MGKINRSYKMYLLHVSTGRIYRSAVVVAILLLAIQDAYSFEGPIVYTYGHPGPGNGRYSRYINLPASYWGAVSYRAKLTSSWRISSVAVVDHTGVGVKVWMSKWPPCYNPEIMVTSREKRNINVKIEVYVESR